MENVAADRDPQTANVADAAADGQGVQQRLGRMLVRAVAGVDDRAVDLAGEQLHGAGRLMADDQQVGPHRVERHRRVDQRLTLLQRRGGDRHGDHVGAETAAGNFEGRLGPGRVLEEQIEQRLARQHVDVLGPLLVQFDVSVAQIQELIYVEPVQALDPQQMPVGKGIGEVRHVGAPVILGGITERGGRGKAEGVNGGSVSRSIAP